MANTAPPPTNTTPAPAMEAGLSIQASVPFAVGASSPSNSDVNAVHALAASLKNSLNAGASRVQLQAYGGPKGDKGSDSRRLSLKRALVIRELLIEDGVPSEKIDVRAMGGADDDSGLDRVDVYIHS
ncbi:MAG: OmpA family protein [Alphaproteobacteria bacterium]|nr:OmpA family protein [Alphaproteobacteria bacterium]